MIIYPIVLKIIDLTNSLDNIVFTIFTFIGFGLLIFFIKVIYSFVSYHHNLIDKNRTTIEELDEKRGNKPTVSYDVSKELNW